MLTLPADRRPLLSSLWAFILFNMIFRDLHQFLAPGYIKQMMIKARPPIITR